MTKHQSATPYHPQLHTRLTFCIFRRSASVAFQSVATGFGFVANVARGKSNFEINYEGKVILPGGRIRVRAWIRVRVRVRQGRGKSKGYDKVNLKARVRARVRQGRCKSKGKDKVH
jgi:hypothetical protein